MGGKPEFRLDHEASFWIRSLFLVTFGVTCGRRRPPSGRWNIRWSIWRCSPRRASGGPRSGSGTGTPRSGPGSSSTPGRQSSPVCARRTCRSGQPIGRRTGLYVQQHPPHWSEEQCPRPGSTPPLFLWQREVETDWWSGREAAVSVDGDCTTPRQQRAALTFLLPSVTVRGTGMGGHLLRLGCGFSLFHTMMIWKSMGAGHQEHDIKSVAWKSSSARKIGFRVTP